DRGELEGRARQVLRHDARRPRPGERHQAARRRRDAPHRDECTPRRRELHAARRAGRAAVAAPARHERPRARLRGLCVRRRVHGHRALAPRLPARAKRRGGRRARAQGPLAEDAEAAMTMPFGAQVLEGGGVRFRLWAPAATAVDLVIDNRSLPLEKREDGWFERVDLSAGPGTLYRYRINGGVLVPDPASRFQPQDCEGPSEVVDPDAFRWTDGG